MIIVEGCDNSGKTTLALSLAKAMKLVFVKNCIRPGDKQELLSWAQFMRGFNPNDRLILDRFSVISELIYGKLLREKPLIDKRDAYIALLAINPTIVYCRPSLGNIRNLGTREQMDGVEESLEQIVNAYDELMDKLKNHLDLRVIDYDWTADNLQDLIHEVSTR